MAEKVVIINMGSNKEMFHVGIVVLSDKGSKGEREDLSGPKIRELLPDDLYEVVSCRVIPDEQSEIEAELIRLADSCGCELILTSGGTGLSLRDVTPEATLAVADRNVPGIAEAIRANSMKYTKRAMLSRAVCVTRGKTLIVNLPGSPKAVAECLEFLLDALEHGLSILTGQSGECAR
jgi:molybdenum cofactor synthesis domain-containing protein